MTVYVIRRGQYTESWIVSIHATYRLAEAAANRYLASTNWSAPDPLRSDERISDEFTTHHATTWDANGGSDWLEIWPWSVEQDSRK